MLTFIYAQDLNGGIGYQNQLPWHLPNDLKHFKKQTMGHTIVMGRKTFESMDCRLLPGRRSVVVTQQKDYGKDISELTVLHSIEDVLEKAENEPLIVIGGASLYQHLWEHVDRIIRTVIRETFPADTHLPAIDEASFERVKCVEGKLDEKNKHPHHYEWWVRKGMN